jgi:HK97 family phage prohead protease
VTNIETRSVELRADAETGVVEGIAVPWNERATIGGRFEEMFERGSIGGGDIRLFWEHREAIGKVIESEDRAEGFWIRAQISDTAQGRDARTLLRDGVVDRFSVGFLPVEHRTESDGLIVRTRVDLKEVSAVVFPAYSGAAVSEARQAASTTHNPKETTVSENTENTAEVAELRTTIEALDRRLEVTNSRLAEQGEPASATDTRSAGEILKALVKGDETTTRAYTGGTTADTVVKDAWVGDLTRLIDEAAPLRGLFATGTLPAEGLNVEYGQLKSDTSTVEVQAKEGDNLVFGKVQLETKFAPVKTIGGFTQLSRQEIERSSMNILNASLNAQAIAAGKALNGLFRAEYVKGVADSVTAGNTVTAPGAAGTYVDWLNAIVDAAGIYSDNGLSLDALVVDTATFKKLIALQGSDGRPVFLITGAGTNNVGAVSVKGLTGDIAGVRIVLDPKLTAGKNAFVNTNALREYRSPLVRLQDDNIINLSKDFSVYSYTAIAHELPNGIVPLKAA